MSKKSAKLNGRSHGDARKFKISIIGDMGTGKTCLSTRFVKNLFIEAHKATISDIETKSIEIQGQCVVFQIWDTAGQERFRSLLPLYMKGIDGAVIVYDVTDKVTYDSVDQWVTEIRKYSEESTVIMVVGNKIDLAGEDDSGKQISTKNAKSWCRFHDILFYESSAKTGDNVNELFLALGEAMLMKTKEPCQYMYRTSSCISDYSQTDKKCC